MPWLERQPRLWPIVREALHSLMHDYEQVIIEGGGSPAEINLRASDIVNMRVAHECQADVYLVADIDRGGASPICSAPGIVSKPRSEPSSKVLY